MSETFFVGLEAEDDADTGVHEADSPHMRDTLCVQAGAECTCPFFTIYPAGRIFSPSLEAALERGLPMPKVPTFSID